MPFRIGEYLDMTEEVESDKSDSIKACERYWNFFSIFMISLRLLIVLFGLLAVAWACAPNMPKQDHGYCKFYGELFDFGLGLGVGVGAYATTFCTVPSHICPIFS